MATIDEIGTLAADEEGRKKIRALLLRLGIFIGQADRLGNRLFADHALEGKSGARGNGAVSRPKDRPDDFACVPFRRPRTVGQSPALACHTVTDIPMGTMGQASRQSLGCRDDGPLSNNKDRG